MLQAGGSLATFDVASSSPVGPVVFFFGCRNRAKDFLYEEEWARLFGTSPAQRDTSSRSHGDNSSSSSDVRPGASSMFTAFSRDQPQKASAEATASCFVQFEGITATCCDTLGILLSTSLLKQRASKTTDP